MKKKYQSPMTSAVRLDVNEMLALSDPQLSDGPSDPGLGTDINRNVWEDLW